MPNNVYNFRQTKLADPKRLKMIAGEKTQARRLALLCWLSRSLRSYWLCGCPSLAETIYRRDRTGVRFGFYFGAGHRRRYHRPGTPKPETGLYATQNATKAKLQNGGFANWSAAAARYFSKLHAHVSRGRKAPMRAISGVAAERSKSTAWMWARH